jgi:hypothetical protein
VTRLDPLVASNRHVRALAELHGLQTLTAEDGELRVRCGPRRSTNHASYGLRAGCWTVFVEAPHPTAGQGLGYLETKLRAAGAVRVVRLDLELYADVAEADFLGVADSSRWTRPRRRVALTPEARAIRAAAARRLTVARAQAGRTER